MRMLCLDEGKWSCWEWNWRLKRWWQREIWLLNGEWKSRSNHIWHILIYGLGIWLRKYGLIKIGNDMFNPHSSNSWAPGMHTWGAQTTKHEACPTKEKKTRSSLKQMHQQWVGMISITIPSWLSCSSEFPPWSLSFKPSPVVLNCLWYVVYVFCKLIQESCQSASIEGKKTYWEIHPMTDIA